MKGKGFKIFEKQRIRMKRFTKESEDNYDDCETLKNIDDIIKSKKSLKLVSFQQKLTFRSRQFKLTGNSWIIIKN